MLLSFLFLGAISGHAFDAALKDIMDCGKELAALSRATYSCIWADGRPVDPRAQLGNVFEIDSDVFAVPDDKGMYVFTNKPEDQINYVSIPFETIGKYRKPAVDAVTVKLRGRPPLNIGIWENMDVKYGYEWLGLTLGNADKKFREVAAKDEDILKKHQETMFELQEKQRQTNALVRNEETERWNNLTLRQKIVEKTATLTKRLTRKFNGIFKEGNVDAQGKAAFVNGMQAAIDEAHRIVTAIPAADRACASEKVQGVEKDVLLTCKAFIGKANAKYGDKISEIQAKLLDVKKDGSTPGAASDK